MDIGNDPDERLADTDPNIWENIGKVNPGHWSTGHSMGKQRKHHPNDDHINGAIIVIRVRVLAIILVLLVMATPKDDYQ